MAAQDRFHTRFTITIRGIDEASAQHTDNTVTFSAITLRTTINVNHCLVAFGTVQSR